MKIIAICLWCLALVNFADAETVKIGSNLTITSDFEDDFSIDTFEVKHKNLVTNDYRFLANISNYESVNQTKVEEDGYTIDVSKINNTIYTVQLVIKMVAFEDDGVIEFYAKNSTEQIENNIHNLTVLRGATNLILTVNHLNPVSSSNQTNNVHLLSDPENDTSVLCVAEGSNPGISNFSMTFNGQALADLTLEYPQIMSTNQRIYNSSVHAAIDTTEMEDERQTVECTITDPVSVTLSTKVYFKVDLSGTECRRPLMSLVLFLMMTVFWYQF